VSDELWRKGAGELAWLIRSGQASAREVTQSHLDRIAAVNPTLNAIPVVLADEALAAADAADERRAAGAEGLGPLHGVPVTIKENVDVAGTATTNGVPALAEAVADRDAPVVERLRAAGAIVIGRTNLPDLGLRIHTDSSLRGLTRNPWHADRTTGGSSGGEAAALAAGMTPLGVGNDIGGSLRNPAHCCGVASIKPTQGRVPHATVIDPVDGPLSYQFMLTNGIMARSVEDVRLGLGIVAGQHPRDPESVPAPLSYPDSAARGTVALVAAPPGGTTDAGIAELTRRAAQHLADAEYEVEEVTPPGYEAAVELWNEFLWTELHLMRAQLEAVIGGDGLRFLTGVLDAHGPRDLAGYFELFVQRRSVARAWLEFFETYPIVLSPIWSQPAFPHGWDADHPQETVDLLRPVMPANLLGLPAAAVPAGLADGMPVGVQCIAAPFREDRALQAASVIEAAVGRLTPVDPFVS
jgi:amidase